MVKIKDFLINNIWILAIVLSLPTAWALLVPGFFGASDDMHIAWLYEMDQVVRMGQVPPRFVPDLSFGFGYPLFSFVFPLPFYIGELFHLSGFNLVDSIKAVFFISFPLSALFMYKLLKEFTDKWLALCGAMIYIFTPYRSTDIYVRGAIGEALAFVLLPLIVLSVVKLSANLDKVSINIKWIVIGSLSLAGLILTHNITAYMFLPFVLILSIIQIFFIREFKKIFVLQLLLMVVLGLLGSIYFWLPAILDSNLMVYDTVFNFADHFPTLKQLLLPYFGYGASVPGPGDGMSFFIGTINLFLVILGNIFLIFFWQRYSVKQKILLIWATISFAVAFLMMNYRSNFLWQNIPLLPYFQFPWRFLIITTFTTPILIISLGIFKKNILFGLVLIIMVILLNAGYFKPHDFLGRRDDYFLNRYIPVPLASSEYLKTGEEYLRLLKSTQKRPDRNYPLAESQTGEIRGVSYINKLDFVVETFSENGMILDINKYSFPGWTTLVDENKTDIESGKPFGQIQISLPAGEHKIRIYFQETTFKKILDLVSLIAIVMTLLLLGTEQLRKFCFHRLR